MHTSPVIDTLSPPPSFLYSPCCSTETRCAHARFCVSLKGHSQACAAHLSPPSSSTFVSHILIQAKGCSGLHTAAALILSFSMQKEPTHICRRGKWWVAILKSIAANHQLLHLTALDKAVKDIIRVCQMATLYDTDETRTTGSQGRRGDWPCSTGGSWKRRMTTAMMVTGSVLCMTHDGVVSLLSCCYSHPAEQAQPRTKSRAFWVDWILKHDSRGLVVNGPYRRCSWFIPRSASQRPRLWWIWP